MEVEYFCNNITQSLRSNSFVINQIFKVTSVALFYQPCYIYGIKKSCVGKKNTRRSYTQLSTNIMVFNHNTNKEKKGIFLWSYRPVNLAALLKKSY